MIYLQNNDLLSESYERFINDSSADFNKAIDAAELRCIGVIKTLIRGRYDVDVIFDKTSPLRDEFLVEILSKLTIHKLIGRNAARKLPTDTKENYNWAMKQLELLNSGKLQLDLPIPTAENGQDGLSPIFGNNTNNDLYI